MLQVVHPVLAGICEVGGNGLVYLTWQSGDGSVTDPGVIEVADVEPEYLLHARNQCPSKT